MKKSIIALTLAAYLSMLFLGVANSLIGAAARNINLSPFQIGLLLTIQNVGFMLAVWISGTLADTKEKPKILLVGSLILAFSFFTFYLTGVFWLNLIIMMLIGAGVGTYEGVTDPMLLDMHSKRQSLHININHLFLEMDWRISLSQSAAVVLLLALFYAIFRLPPKKGQNEDYLQRIRILSREKLVVALFIATVLVVGVELGTIGILTTYLMELQGFTQTTSKVGLVTFLSGIAIGRIVVGFASRQEHISNYILILFGLATIFFAFLFIVDLGQWSYMSIFLAGLGLSGLLPLMITLAGIVYPQMAGTVIGSIKVAIPIGGILIPLLMSLVTGLASFKVSLLIFPLALLLAFSILFFQFRRSPILESPPA
jgi:fucose permease